MKENMQQAQHRKSRKKSGRKYRTVILDRAEYMGIDWGKSDVGVALAEKDTRIAYACCTLSGKQNVIDRLGEIIQEKGIKTVVIGIPSPINRNEVEYIGERLGEVLEHNFGVNVDYQNEMFTTKMAQQSLVDRGVRGIERYDDQEAARIILQDWLDRQVLKNEHGM